MDDNSKLPPKPDSIQSLRHKKVGTLLAKQKFDWPIAVTQIIGYVFGLLGITVVALILGATFNQALVSHSDQYFGILADYSAIIYALPITLLIFGIIAFATRNFLYLAYPIVAFYLGQEFIGTDLVKYLAGNIPAVAPENQPHYFSYLVTVTLCYALLYIGEKPLRSIVMQYRRKTLDNTTLITNIGILASVSIVGIILSFAATPLYIYQLRERSIINVPNSNIFLGEAKSAYLVTTPAAEINKTKQRSSVGNVNIKPLEEWWNRDIRTVCGDTVSRAAYPGQKVTQEYKTTPRGIQYAESVFQGNTSQPFAKTKQYQIIYNCFVIGYQQYYLERSVLGGRDVLTKYQTGDIIDTIVSGTKVVPGCNGDRAQYFRQCTAEDQKITNKLTQAKQKADSILLPKQNTPPETVLNPSAYIKIDELKIAEWGIKLPLSGEVKDLYYTPSTKNSLFINGTLRSVADQRCNTNGNAVVKGVNTVTFARKLKTEEDTRKDLSITFHTPNKQIGDYLYAVYTSGNARSCLGDERARIVQDVLDWATVSIEPL